MGWIPQYYGIIGILLAATTAYLAWRQLRKKEPSTTSLKHSRVDHSPIFSGSHNQVVIGYAPSEPKQAERPKAERALPNLVYVGAKRKDIFVSRWPLDGICDPCTEEQRRNSIHALVLKFENRIVTSDRKIARAMNVIAKLRFHHKNGVTERDVDYGVWLNSPCNSTDFGIGDTRELILIYVYENELVTFEDRRADNRDFSSEGYSYVEETDVTDYEWADITLIDQSTQVSLRVKLKFWRDGDSFRTAEL